MSRESSQVWYSVRCISHAGAFSVASGKLFTGWDKILEGGLAPNAIVMSWRVSVAHWRFQRWGLSDWRGPLLQWT